MNYVILSDIGKALELDDVVSEYSTKARTMAGNINIWLRTAEGLYHDGLYGDLSPSQHVSQHANMMALVAGIVPEPLESNVIQLVKDKRMSVGMVTLRWLPEALGVLNEGSHLLELYTNPSWDGWAQSISRGATVTWESWDAPEHNLSLSHPWGAVGLLGIKEYIAGIKILEPQHRLIQIKPLDFDQGLNFVTCTVPTDRGQVSVEWTRNEDHFNMEISIPDNVRADVYLPISGNVQNLVSVNGKMVEASKQGEFLYVNRFGSGTHRIETVP